MTFGPWNCGSLGKMVWCWCHMTSIWDSLSGSVTMSDNALTWRSNSLRPLLSLSSAFPFPLQIILKTRTVEQPAEEAQTLILLFLHVYMWAELCYSILQHTWISREKVICYQFHFRPDDDWSIQSKCRQKLFSELKLVTDNLLSIYAAANWEATERKIHGIKFQLLLQWKCIATPMASTFHNKMPHHSTWT